MSVKYESLEILLHLIPPLEGVAVPDDVETVYVYGLGGGEYFAALESWLAQNRAHHLIFLEDELEALRALFSHPLFSHDQVHVEFSMNQRRWNDHLEPLVKRFPSAKIAIFATNAYRKRALFRSLKIDLMRHHTLERALFLENFYIARLCKNLFPNFQRWSSSSHYARFKGAFAGIPAVVCGAGPSLKRLKEELKGVEEKALFLAGGSGIAALAHLGIEPHFGVAFDPNLEELHRIEQIRAFDFPLFYGSRVLPDIFSALNGPAIYVRSHTGGPVEQWFEEKVGIEDLSPLATVSRESLSVTTGALALAQYMGCNPIFLAGVDLAYTGGLRYAEGVLSPDANRYKGALRKNGKSTTIEWVMESKAISEFAQTHPETAFYNLSTEGLGFAAIENRELSLFSFEQRDLRSRIHALLQSSPAVATQEQLHAAFDEWRESLERCLENPADEREEAHTYFIASALRAIETELVRQGRPESDKWKLIKLIIEECLKYIPI